MEEDRKKEQKKINLVKKIGLALFVLLLVSVYSASKFHINLDIFKGIAIIGMFGCMCVYIYYKDFK